MVELNPAGVGRASSFSATYWWQGPRPVEASSSFRPDQVDGLEYRELADNLPTLCWIANADGYITWYNRRWHEYCGTTSAQMEGWGWQSVHDPDVLPAVMEGWTGSIASGQAFEMVFPLRGADGILRPFRTRIIPLRDKAGAVQRWIGNNVEISAQAEVEKQLRRSEEELKEANQALADREAFLSSVLAASTDCIKVLELDGSLSFMSEGGMKVMDIGDFNDVAGCPWPDLLKGEGVAQATTAIEAACEGRSSHFELAAETFTGTLKWWSVSVSPIRDASGRVTRILSVSRDHTALREAHKQQRLLNDELSHRLKNTLAMVLSIATQTLRSVPDKAPVEAFEKRIYALSSAHDILLKETWTVAPFEAVASAVISIVAPIDRFDIDGPSVLLGPRAALSASLLLHELATNAVKYGALSNDVGRVAISWRFEGAGEEQELVLNWREEGGPPAVAPTRRGFGSRLIRMGLVGTGGAELHYLASGFEAEMRAPLAHIRQS